MCRRSLSLVLFVFAAGCSKKGDAGACSPGTVQACFDGPEGTQGVGPCVAGTSTCGADRAWGPCEGDVLPSTEVCANAIDEDCSGTPDDGVEDPNAVEIGGNGADDDCDGTTDVLATCDAGLASNSPDPRDHAKAIDLCLVTTTAAASPGLISAAFTLGDGSGSPNADQRSIRPTFGGITPRFGDSLSVLATGRAAATGHTNPPPGDVAMGADFGTTSALPADWLAANGGSIPELAACPPSTTTASDPIMLTLTVRVPSNARAFAVDVFFVGAEFPEYVCSAFDDTFIALLESGFAGTPANPPDGNIASASGRAMSVNWAYDATFPFTVCKNGPIGCDGGTTSNIATCLSTSALAGTGYDIADATGLNCVAGDLKGGGTGWLTARGNVVPNEIVTLRFLIWDASDHVVDSAVFLDNFRWLATEGETGID